MAKIIMVQGTMSNAGKSLLTAGLCRIFRQDGYRVAPFKSQNMALNSFITADGREMGRAQVMQAEAAGIAPQVCMNPILLKPTGDTGSQVIVNGRVLGNMPAREYFRFKKSLIPEIVKAFRTLEEMADIIVIEGAGSPAEINLKTDDIVNMGLAKILDAPVLLAGDIDRGGVFAQLLGTLMLLEKEEKERVKGLIINKFRGDKSILDPGITMLEERGGIPVVGVIPYMNLSIDDEDSLSERFDRKGEGLVNIGVVRLPRISNFTDFSVFEQIEGVGLRYVTRPSELEQLDMLILPGSKNTIADMKYVRESGLESAIVRFAGQKPVFGICGGYQMLGRSISDPDGIEEGGEIRGIGLLPVDTVLCREKTTRQVTGRIGVLKGPFANIGGMPFKGYEIHMGESIFTAAENGSATDLSSGRFSDLHADDGIKPDGAYAGNVYGTYVHGIFDENGIAAAIALSLAERKGVTLTGGEASYRDFKEQQYDLLADGIRRHMDMDRIYQLLRESNIREC